MLRRKVTALRYRGFAAERARDRADYTTALAAAATLVKESEIWEPVHAEMLYLLGTTQSQGGNSKQGLATLREAAAVAQVSHQDYMSANAWTQLALSTTSDEGDAIRGLEYITYAEAAVERLGHPPETEAVMLYVKGATLVDAGRSKEAEVASARPSTCPSGTPSINYPPRSRASAICSRIRAATPKRSRRIAARSCRCRARIPAGRSRARSCFASTSRATS